MFCKYSESRAQCQTCLSIAGVRFSFREARWSGCGELLLLLEGDVDARFGEGTSVPTFSFGCAVGLGEFDCDRLCGEVAAVGRAVDVGEGDFEVSAEVLS